MNEKPVIIKGTVYWAFLSKPNTYNPDKPKYQIDIGDLSDAAVKALESINVTANHKDDKGFYITCKSNYPITAYDSNGEVIPPDVQVGNGSKAVATVASFPWTFKGRKGYSPSIVKGGLKITELVEYVAAPALEVAEEEAL